MSNILKESMGFTNISKPETGAPTHMIQEQGDLNAFCEQVTPDEQKVLNEQTKKDNK